MKRIKWLVGAVIVVAACGGQTQTVAPRTDLFGRWQLDAAATDSLRPNRFGGDEDGGAQGRSGRAGRPGGRGGMGGGMGGRGGMGGGMGGRGGMGGSPAAGRGGSGGMEQTRAVMEAFRRGTESMTLSPITNGVRVHYGERDVDLLYGKSVKHDIGELQDVKSKAKWVDQHLEIEHKLKGVKVLETFERGVDSPRLLVTTSIQTGFRPVTFHRVYVKD